MPILAMAVPVPPGKVTTLEQHIAEAMKREDIDDTLTGFGIRHESWHIQESPEGPLLIMVFDAEDPLAMLESFSRSQKDLPVWQRAFLKKALGIDLSEPPPGPPSRSIFNWP